MIGYTGLLITNGDDLRTTIYFPKVQSTSDDFVVFPANQKAIDLGKVLFGPDNYDKGYFGDALVITSKNPDNPLQIQVIIL